MINLKLITGYLCNHVSPDYEDRFYENWEIVEEAVGSIGPYARLLLVVLAKAAPDGYNASYIAAGPLESYINLVVEKHASEEAAFIVRNESLRPLLKDVWGDIQQLEPLAKLSTKNDRGMDIPVETDLTTLTIKEVAGFWCQMCVSSIVSNYQEIYQQVLDKLFNPNTREQVKHDLLLSAPDKKAQEYLESDIFILHDDPM